MITRQPPSGRSNCGGHRVSLFLKQILRNILTLSSYIKVGEMESTCIVSAGASQVHQCLWSMSDETKWKICPTCNLYQPLSAKHCFSCKDDHIALQEITIPYAWKLLTMELLQCGIHLKDASVQKTGGKHILAST